jgi:hypothetical protein
MVNCRTSRGICQPAKKMPSRRGSSFVQLVQNLFDGPIDIVGDVHGELDALRDLLHQLGYSPAGLHPAGRRLVFLGDLTDRGPDSPGVVDLVAELVRSGNSQCVLGNHELNILLGHKKLNNDWFFGQPFVHEGRTIPQVLADDMIRAKVVDFFRTLPWYWSDQACAWFTLVGARRWSTLRGRPLISPSFIIVTPV